MVVALHVWVYLVALVMLMYALRHWVLTLNRVTQRQRPYYQDMVDSEYPALTILIPMHNEEAVAEGVLNALVESDYPKDRCEIIPIDDHSGDRTPEILQRFSQIYPYIKPLHRRSGLRGKPVALNDGLKAASHEIVIVFDADYLPPRGLLRDLAMAFLDPEVGAVMGRVVPHNTQVGLVTRLLDLERSGGYQVDQQGATTSI